MKKIFMLFGFLFLNDYFIFSQSVGIGTSSPNSSSQLEISSSSKGLLIPRMTTSVINSIVNPAKGLLVYDTVKNQLMVNMGTGSSKNWQTIVYNSGWNLTGNSGTNPSAHFIGTTDNNPVSFRVGNVYAGKWDQAGNYFIGDNAGTNNTAGFSNLAIGSHALFLNTVKSNLVAIGDSALYNNGTGATSVDAINNTAIGSKALYANITGSANTATGYHALYSNTSGYGNVANGFRSLISNTTGGTNVAVGVDALYANTAAYDNVAIGSYALSSSSGSLGSYNTAVGTLALGSTTNSQYNTALGYSAGLNRDNGYNNVFIGALSDVTQSNFYNCIAIGKSATCFGPSEAFIGNSATGVIGGAVNWSVVSDGRYKTNINENVKGLEFITRLRPVTYQLNATALSNKLNEGRGAELDSVSKLAIAEKEKTVFTGFVAQEVEQAANDIGFNFSGVIKPKDTSDLYRVRYAEFVVPLVKAVQEQQQQIEELRKENKEQKERNDLLQKQIDELKSLIKK